MQSVDDALGWHRCMLESSELSRLSPITNTEPSGTGPADQLQVVVIGPLHAIPGVCLT